MDGITIGSHRHRCRLLSTPRFISGILELPKGNLHLPLALDLEHPEAMILAMLELQPDAARASFVCSGRFPMHGALSHKHPTVVFLAILEEHAQFQDIHRVDGSRLAFRYCRE